MTHIVAEPKIDLPSQEPLAGADGLSLAPSNRTKRDDISGNAYYLDRQAGFESNARTYPRKLPIAIRRAEGIYVEDTDGRRYIDCLAGAGALTLGHYHPVVVEAVQRAVADGVPWQTLDLTTPIKDCSSRNFSLRCRRHSPATPVSSSAGRPGRMPSKPPSSW